MSLSLPPYRYKSPALYNPRLWQAEEVRAYYVARPGLLNRIVDDLKREAPASRPQHRLIVGLRGMGKSTLLRRLAVAIEDDAELHARWLPLSFPEEQYNVARLSDFWLNCLDALSDLLESRGRVAESRGLDDEVERLDRKDGEGALNALLRCSARLERRLVLLVDNIDLVFERLKDDEWKLREALQAHPELLVVGASAQALEATYDYRAAFYDFFKVDELRGLSEAEMRETIVNLARLNQAEHIVRRLDADPARLKVLHTLTGGNPRTAVLLYGVLLKGIDGDVRSDLEGLLDEVTPLYKARFEELPPQSQQLLDKLALHWHPANAAILAEQLGWKVNLVSAQLDRLINAGIVERVKAPKSKRLHFQIGERFFNIWYLMRTSRRLRRRLIWLVECLRGLYSADEREAMARRALKDAGRSARDAETLLALGDAIDDSGFKRALTDRVIEMLHDVGSTGALGELFDLDGADAAVKDRSGAYARRAQARAELVAALTGTEDEGLVGEIDLGLPGNEVYCKTAEEILAHPHDARASLIEAIKKRAHQSVSFFGKKVAGLLASAMQSAHFFSLDDIEGGRAAAIRFDQPTLSAIFELLSINISPNNLATLEGICRTILDFDDSGHLPWYFLAASLDIQDKHTDAVAAAKRALDLSESFPGDSLIMLIILVEHDDPSWRSLAQSAISHIDLTDTKAAQRLVEFAHIVDHCGKSETLLDIMDSAECEGRFAPLREAVRAAAAKDPSLLGLLAPEVRDPAVQILHKIAPQLAKPAS